MLKKLILLVVFANVFLACFAQQIPQFGKITNEELNLKDCSFEHGAGAMYLVKYEQVDFDANNYGDLKITTQTICRIKIFDKTGYDEATIVIPFSGKNRTARITNLDATTYNVDENGKIISSDVNKKEIFKDKSSEKDGVSTVRFTFPNVKPGSVLEYRYTKIEKNSFFINPWFFQGSIPTLLSYCKIKIPGFSELEVKSVAQLPIKNGPEENAGKKDITKPKVRSFYMEKVPSFKMEPFMSSLADNLMHLEFSLNPSIGFFSSLSNLKWGLINSVFLSSAFFGKQFDKDIYGTVGFVDSIKKVDSLEERINGVYNYVKNHLTWDKTHTFYADDISQVWQDKQGNSAEINLIILNLLRKAGVTCFPVLFSTRSNGKVDMNFPNPTQFNSVDVLAFIGDKYFILDGTQKYISYKIPPFDIINRNVFIVDHENNKWVNVDDERFLIHDSISVTGKVDENGTINGQAEITYYDLSKATEIEDNKDDDKDDNDFLLSDAPVLKIDTSFYTDKENDLLPLKRTIKFHYDLSSTDSFYFLNPFMLSTFRKNPFVDSTRLTDIDFGANSSFILHMEITLPPNIHVEEFTRNKIIRTPDTILLFNRFNELQGNTLIINSTFNISAAIFYSDDYPAIRDFFKNVYAILNQQILLKRK